MDNDIDIVTHNYSLTQHPMIRGMYEVDLSRIEWVYLRNPNGHVQKINAREKDCIGVLLGWGWKQIRKP